jgi:predicted branched-subunit amino acid permease
MSAIPLSSAARAAFKSGFGDMLGAALGVLAWGLVTGVAMVKSGLPVVPSVIISLTAYAGSAQLATLPLVLAGASWWLILLTAVVVNLRFLVYAASLAQIFSRARPWHRFLLGYFNGDVTFVRLLTHLERKPGDPNRIAFYWGAVCANWLAWQIGSLAGIFAADAIPATWGLELAGILVLVAVAAPALRARPALLGAIVAGAVAYLARGLPLRLGVMVGLVAGIGAAMLIAPRNSGEASP